MIKKSAAAFLAAMSIVLAGYGCAAAESANTAPVQEEAAPQEEPAPAQAEAPAEEEAAPAQENEAEAEAEHADNQLVIGGRTYSGLTNLKNENNDDGTYFYQDMTSDGVTVITNMSAPNSQRDGQDMDAYAINFICALIDNDARVEDPVPDETLSEKFTYPVYKAVWESGSNEDTRKSEGIVVLTDLYTYYYGFGCPIDDYEDNEEFYKEELSDLELRAF